VFAERRAKLIAAVNAPIVIFGYTGHEEANPSYVFMQEENFYYLTGHNEEGAALLLVPESAARERLDRAARNSVSAAARPERGKMERAAHGSG
jgi:hypothetical protein